MLSFCPVPLSIAPFLHGQWNPNYRTFRVPLFQIIILFQSPRSILPTTCPLLPGRSHLPLDPAHSRITGHMFLTGCLRYNWIMRKSRIPLQFTAYYLTREESFVYNTKIKAESLFLLDGSEDNVTVSGTYDSSLLGNCFITSGFSIGQSHKRRRR